MDPEIHNIIEAEKDRQLWSCLHVSWMILIWQTQNLATNGKQPFEPEQALHNACLHRANLWMSMNIVKTRQLTILQQIVVYSL